MIGPYPVADERRTYFDYFSRLIRHVKELSLRGKQTDCLLYFANHPVSSAYKIKPPSKTSDSEYKWAKEAVKQLHTYGLIERARIGKHSSSDYSLTDEGIYYLIKNTNLPYSMLLQDLIKNYSNSNIFQYLVYLYIKLETLCSSKMDLQIIAGIGNYLVSTFQKMDRTLLLLDKQERSEIEVYSWNYDKLEEYLRSTYHYDFINIADCEEDSDEDHIEIKYFDSENNNKDVKVIFDKRNKEGYVYTTNKKVKKRRIPLITDYLQKKIITQYDHRISYFDAFCSPRAEEFILSISSIDTYNDDIREILSNDKSFMKALKETKDHFDRVYRQIISYPDFPL
jgi:hypothetical protein